MTSQPRARDGRFMQTMHGESDVDLGIEDQGSQCPECGRDADPGQDLCEDCKGDLLCRECGERNDDGDGSDGLCGNCADRNCCPECFEFSEGGALCEECSE